MNLQICEEASEWIIRHRDGGLGPKAKRDFDAWLRQSPEHAQAYLEVSSLWELLSACDLSSSPSANELIARAREEGNVVSLALVPRVEAHAQVAVRAMEQKAMDRARRMRGVMAGIAASILIALIGTWFSLQRGVYATAIGEQRSITLADGSTVELNSRSRIRVRYTESERRIDLLKGQALFRVARNKARPFIVETNAARVRAVGTEFDVYDATSGTIVTVLEGSVAVHGPPSTPSSESVQSARAKPVNVEQEVAGRQEKDVSAIQPRAREILLAAGEQLVVTPAVPALPKRVNVNATTAWTRRSLVFDSTPLPAVAEEFNRYNRRRLIVDGHQLADFHVSGVFSSVEPTLFLRFLCTQPELLVVETDSEVHISRK